MITALLGAVEAEISLAVHQLERMETGRVEGRKYYQGILGGKPTVIAETGIGAVNAAITLMDLKARHALERVLMVGCAGVYPEAGLGVGDVAIASEERYAEFGVESIDGWRPFEQPWMRLLPHTITDRPGAFEFDRKQVAALERVAGGLGQARAGKFITVNGVSGDLETARRRGLLFDALVENMEGAGAAHVCALYNIPFAEVRGVSNMAGVRDKNEWKFQEAVQKAQEVALRARREMIW